MINFNGEFINATSNLISVYNRGLNYGDAIFETIRYENKNILFWEDHYFRLMSSMRIMRMNIPMSFTSDFLESQIIQTISLSVFDFQSVRVKILVFRDSDGLYAPEKNDSVKYLITCKELGEKIIIHREIPKVDLFKDYFVSKGLLSNIKTTSRAINILASIYAKENNLDNCLLLNENKRVVEAINANIFVVNGNCVRTPLLSEGCVNGIMRKQIIRLLKKNNDYSIVEDEITPFDIQKSEGLFFTNVISGIMSVRRYKKTIFSSKSTLKLVELLTKDVVES